MCCHSAFILSVLFIYFILLAHAEKKKRRTYPELVDSSRLRLVTVATEVGGRFSKTARELLEVAAACRARGEPRALQPAAARRWCERWLTMLSVSAQDALAATLVDDGVALLDGHDGCQPPPADLWLGTANDSGQSSYLERGDVHL